LSISDSTAREAFIFREYCCAPPTVAFIRMRFQPTAYVVTYVIETLVHGGLRVDFYWLARTGRKNRIDRPNLVDLDGALFGFGVPGKCHL